MLCISLQHAINSQLNTEHLNMPHTQTCNNVTLEDTWRLLLLIRHLWMKHTHKTLSEMLHFSYTKTPPNIFILQGTTALLWICFESVLSGWLSEPECKTLGWPSLFRLWFRTTHNNEDHANCYVLQYYIFPRGSSLGEALFTHLQLFEYCSAEGCGLQRQVPVQLTLGAS